jgi:hypothetical protein
MPSGGSGVAFATIDEAWGDPGLRATSAPRRPRPTVGACGSGGGTGTGRGEPTCDLYRRGYSGTVVEDIMEMYTASPPSGGLAAAPGASADAGGGSRYASFDQAFDGSAGAQGSGGPRVAYAPGTQGQGQGQGQVYARQAAQASREPQVDVRFGGGTAAPLSDFPYDPYDGGARSSAAPIDQPWTSMAADDGAPNGPRRGERTQRSVDDVFANDGYGTDDSAPPPPRAGVFQARRARQARQARQARADPTGPTGAEEGDNEADDEAAFPSAPRPPARRNRGVKKLEDDQDHSSTRYMELAAYVLSGVLLIFMLESFIKLGINMRAPPVIYY